MGTSTLTAGRSELYLPAILNLVQQIATLHCEGKEVILVTSGAIAAGSEMIHTSGTSTHIPAKQMLAALGQPRLMEIYAQLFRVFKLQVAQVLLTRADLSQRRGYINARNTLTSLMESGIIPIVNENDAVATEEICVGDNDNLSALVANLVEADLLVLLTDQAGLYTSDPRRDANARLIHEITDVEIPAEIWQAAGGTNTGLGIGGMLTKIKAADLARRSGTEVVIAAGDDKEILIRVADHQNVGTRISALISKVESRKRYFLAGIKTSRAVIVVDAGAVKALQSGSSLLPVGVISVNGKFDRGDVVKLAGENETPIAMGLINYAAEDVGKICKHKSEEIETILGYSFGDEVIHRSNLILL